MTLFSKNWTLASFSLTVLSSPYWPWMPPLGLALICPLILILSIRFTFIRFGGGIVLAMLVIITHSNAVKTQSNSIFLAGSDITIKGKVDSFFKQNSYAYDGSVVVYQVNEQQTTAFFSPRIQLYVPIPLYPGDEFEFSVRIKPIIGRLNEVGSDLEAFSMSQGIVARATVKTGASFKVVSKPNWRRLIYQRLQIDTATSSVQGMIMALVLGERSGVTPEQWLKFRNSGLIHLVAISGLHIGIAFGFGFLLGSFLSRFSSKLLWLPILLGAFCAFSYAWLAGFSLPTLRALVMCLSNVAIIFARVNLSLTQRILLTLSIVLTFDPFASLANGFWLSFIAVCFVLYLVQVTQTMTKWRRILTSQIMLVLLMAPISIYFFGGISWTSVLFNLIFIPWFSFVVVPLLFVGILVSLASFSFSEIIWQLVSLSFFPLTWALDQTISGWFLVPDSWQIPMLVLVTVWLVRGLLSRYSLIFILLLCMGWVCSATRKSEDFWQLDVLDVGHGLSVLIEKQGRFLLYDTGSSWRNGSYISSVVAPLIAKRGASSLHTVIYSHLGDDHAGGRRDVTSQLNPRYTYASQPLEDSLACVRGQQWYWQGLELTVVWPPKMVERAYNFHSCVIRLEDKVHGHSVLLSGDVTAAGEWLLAREGVKLKSDIMLVPHHGSKTSSTHRFIEAINPDVAIASLAKGNRWNLPNPEVVERYQDQGIRWLDTGEAGQVSVKFRAENRHLSTIRLYEWEPWYRQMLRKGVE